ncbi:Sulfur carrier protein ThiS (thiamine biosynthesis) [Desulfoscipio geothermicus DSM 3669]|uniref:Sulfur carrier protein ThiS (Thiamine biosynthesis) n=1 Tax=Desulfoscipio geothermicus DSM 3669 TaxID=1121426 RepID=A0A1I6D2U2_9FIRM|nr:Sulfur carrier protein ThiS (thiamine biosynthesis) [Desulfoscipio geothermicus DSM 3669]
MRIEVRVFSGLEKFLPNKSFGEPLPVELPEGGTIRDLLLKIGIPKDHVFTILVDGKHRSFDYTVRDGERISLFPPVGGG